MTSLIPAALRVASAGESRWIWSISTAPGALRKYATIGSFGAMSTLDAATWRDGSTTGFAVSRGSRRAWALGRSIRTMLMRCSIELAGDAHAVDSRWRFR